MKCAGNEIRLAHMKTVAVIGIGRVGLPLSLFMESLGFSVVGIENNPEVLHSIEKRQMPFYERGCAELLSRSRMGVTNDIAAARGVDYIVITVGTPLRMHIETDLSLIESVLKKLVEVLAAGQTVILRSTVAPGTTAYMKKYIELHSGLQVGKEIGLAFCPERIAENKALEELKTLPQIIGCEDELSRTRARDLFARFEVKLFETNYSSAELVKLFNNTLRYIEFAVANQFALIADYFKQNICDIIRMANEDYPRGTIRQPGFTAGACLRKDFGMISELVATPDLLLSAWKVNEYMPYHLVEAVSKCTSLYDKRIAVMGYTFKKNSDDTRDSLVPKLIRYIARRVPRSITICEPHIQSSDIDGYPNRDIATCLTNADVVFIAMNHDCFTDRAMFQRHIKPQTWVVDLWNCMGSNKLVAQMQ